MSGDGRRLLGSDEDWGALLDAVGDQDLGDFEDDEDYADLLAPSEEVQKVSRRIAGQYVEILASFAAAAFGRRKNPVTLERVSSAVDALLRLARAAGDKDQIALLDELAELVEPVTEGSKTSRHRHNALARLRDWLPRFGETLEQEDRDRLTRLVQWDRDDAPLLEELRGLHGIGPKRLQRLYSAGLFTVDAVATADPTDVAAVTGIPVSLAEEVVEATRRFAEAERMRFLEELQASAHRLRRMMTGKPDQDAAFFERAASALHEVEQTLQNLQKPENR